MTFNYDRSLEHFLFSSVRNTYGLTDELALKFVQDLRAVLPQHCGTLAYRRVFLARYVGWMAVQVRGNRRACVGGSLPYLHARKLKGAWDLTRLRGV